jgi:hypothetical protein
MICSDSRWEDNPLTLVDHVDEFLLEKRDVVVT